MDELQNRAARLIDEFKSGDAVYGIGCLPRVGEIAAPFGRRVLLITSLKKRDPGSDAVIQESLCKQGLTVVGRTASSRPNTPREDVIRMRDAIREHDPDLVLVVSGGSGIDAAKAALVLADLGGGFEDYFGTGLVTRRMRETGGRLRPLIAVQTAAGSAAHLSKYSNVTDLAANQKKLIVDEAVIPPKSLFDYALTASMPPDFTCDGGFDSMSHLLEVYYGANPDTVDKLEEIALTGIELILRSLQRAVKTPADLEARLDLGLAADLGGYAIMVGGTNGAHLTSFSLVDILSHGRACAIMNPYYTVFFAPAIQRHLTGVAGLLERYGLMNGSDPRPAGRALGEAVARGLILFARRVDFPATLGEVKGMTDGHLRKALTAAKNPQLKMKLQNMPVPLTADQVDEYMGPILQAGKSGDFSLIRNLES